VLYYEPAEDSYLLVKWARKLARGKVIEIGSGSGIVIESLLGKENIKEIWATDIDEEVVDYLKKKFRNRVRVVRSDLFKDIPKGLKFDTILFNPPYLPEEGWEDYKTKLQTVGGKQGNEIILRFLEEAKDYLSENGFILLIFSSLSNPDDILAKAEELGYKIEILEKIHFDFETLFIAKLVLR